MKRTNTTPDLPALCRFKGTVDALFWLPCGRPMDAATRRRVDLWQIAYSSAGINPSQNKEETDAFRRLVASGHLVSSGITQGKNYTITPLGMAAVMGAVAWDALNEWLSAVAEMETMSQIAMPSTGQKILMGFELVEEAGPWWGVANASDAAWKALQHAQIDVDALLLPCLGLGWLNMTSCSTGRIWGVQTTEAGHAALLSWPKGKATAAGDSEAEGEGWKWALEHFMQANPPKGYEHILYRRLPASRWDPIGV